MKKRILTVLGLALMFAVCATGDAFADTVVSNAVTKATHVFQSVRTIVFVIGGFGLVGLAVQAIFGKVKWAWFGALAVGLGVLAAAGALITYATGDTATEDYSDTFSTNFQAESHMPNS
ncbi:MAG: TrbC/VirB2 family protein [Alphaproteobacteria bacterium]|nr:TrbC/VirB2 family protein [Alphaproteobacteria bacterium]